MSRFDLSAEIDIAREPTDVAGVMFDPHREPDWAAAVTSVDVIDPAMAPGARVRRSGRLLGRDVQWTTAVVACQFPHLLRLQLVDGPFTGTVTFEVGRATGGSRVRIRSEVTLAGAGLLPASLIETSMREGLAADLERLKALLTLP